MKNIKELGLELIQLDDQIVLVDKKLPVFTDEWALELYNGKSKATTPKWIDDTNNVWWLRKMNMNCPSSDPECIKVVASTKQLDNIPLLIIEDEVEKLAINSFGHKPSKEDNDILLSLGKGYIGGFKEGYNKAKSTYKFTEEDMIEFVVWLNNTDEIFEQTKHIDFTKSDKDVGKELLEIWKEQRTNKELWVEIEDKIAIDGHTIIGVEPKIKDGKIKAIWK